MSKLLEDRTVYDIDPNDPDATRAATKIQAVYRGHHTRKSMKSGDGASGEGALAGAAAAASSAAAGAGPGPGQDPEREPTTAELEAEFSPDDKGQRVVKLCRDNKCGKAKKMGLLPP